MAKSGVEGDTAYRLPDAGLHSLSQLFKALGDVQRLRILASLYHHGELSVTALSEMLEQLQPSMSHHLSLLKSAGLIDYRRDGKFHYYQLNPTGLKLLLQTEVGLQDFRLTLGGVEFRAKVK